MGFKRFDTAAVTIDADKVTARGAPAVQVNTGGGCHLDAVMLQAALPQFTLDEIDLMIVENVGNLVCPANFRLGTHANVLIASVPEGDDKPYKYPGMFAAADAVVLNKADLMQYFDFDLASFRNGLAMINPAAPLFLVSCCSGEGLGEWVDWLTGRIP